MISFQMKPDGRKFDILCRAEIGDGQNNIPNQFKRTQTFMVKDIHDVCFSTQGNTRVRAECERMEK